MALSFSGVPSTSTFSPDRMRARGLMRALLSTCTVHTSVFGVCKRNDSDCTSVIFPAMAPFCGDDHRDALGGRIPRNISGVLFSNARSIRSSIRAKCARSVAVRMASVMRLPTKMVR